MEYKLIYSDRRTLSLSVKGGILTVRAPRRTPLNIVESFIKKHEEGIKDHLQREKERCEKFDDFSEDDIKRLKRDAKKYLKDKTEHFANIMGIKYGRITITSAKTRFGSCSSKGNISYSYRLMLYPEAAREYVVVHELSHVCEMNHSKRFYAIVERFMPDYKERRRLLK